MTNPTAAPAAPSPVPTFTPPSNATSTGNAATASSYINITPDNPPPMKTLVIAPDVQILIAHNNKQYDVSADIVSFSVRRPENQVASLVFRLANKKDGQKLRYNQLFDRMDRVILKLKRVSWIQVFSGYLDQVPHVQLYAGTVNFRASCTLKRILYTYWDPGLPSAMEIFDQTTQGGLGEPQDGEQMQDAGLGSMIRHALVNVGGWNPQNIHIQRFPMGYYLLMKAQLTLWGQGPENAGEAFKRLLLGDDTSAGTGQSAGRQLGVTRGSYVLAGPQDRQMEVLRTVDDMGMGPNNSDMAAAQGVGTSATGGEDPRDQQAWKGLTEVGKNWSDAAMKNDAAVQCFMAITIESQWVMYANQSDPETLNFPHEALSTDGSSSGLYQQQKNWGTPAQRMNVRESTGMFLQALARQDWRNMSRGEAVANVQNPRSDLRGKYATVEQQCVQQVQALRQGTGSTPSGQSNPGLTTGLGGIPMTSIPSTLTTAGIPGIGTGATAMPSNNGTPSPTAMPGGTPGSPQYNTAGALSCARAQVGKPYVWGAIGPSSFDCSGLMYYSYRSIGIEIGRDTGSERATMDHIPMSALVPGDLIQPAGEEHVVMFTGAGTVVEAPQPGQNVQERPMGPAEAAGQALHARGCSYGGQPFAAFDPNLASQPGAAPGTVAGGPNGSTTQTGSNEPIARNLFSYQFAPTGKFTSYVSLLFGNGSVSDTGEVGSPPEAAFMNDEPLMHTIVSFCKASLRNFQSAPNGDFVAYYPDYWGLDGKRAVVDLEDIEMKNVQIDFNDDALATHVYVAGSASPVGQSLGVFGWLTTKGIATVENEWLFRIMTMASPNVPGSEVTSGKELMKRFGVRPCSQEMSNLAAGPMEFLVAVSLFMEKWAQQYSTTIDITFMPELFPGMRINLVGHNLQVYVTEVVHSGDWENGFTTQATIMAPANTALASVVTNMFSPTGQQSTNLLDMLGDASTWMS
jgi:cell wall-associated NlpC family hydrolase